MRGQRKRGQQQQRIGQVQREIRRSQWRLALRREPEFDEKRANRRFNQSERNGGDRGDAREMATRGARKSPPKKCNDGEEREAAGDAVRELDHRIGSRRMLHHGPVTKRPVVSAARSRACSAHQPPHKMTAIKYASTPQANRRNANEGGLRICAGAATVFMRGSNENSPV